MSKEQAGGAPPPKAIASLTRKSSEVTRHGTQKLKFVPVLPARRKKEELKQEVITPANEPSTSHGHPGRGKGDGQDRGTGRGRGAARIPVEMVASGPFAMGPADAGSSFRELRANNIPVAPPTATGSFPSELVPIVPSETKKENDLKQMGVDVNDEDIYSEPDEGVKIIDIKNVRQLDWMAPEYLSKEPQKKKGKKMVKKEEPTGPDLGSACEAETHVVDATDMNESDGEELEDIIEDFALKTDTTELNQRMTTSGLYFFQFPDPFPRFIDPSVPTIPTPAIETIAASPIAAPSGSTKKVSFGVTGSSKQAKGHSEPTAELKIHSQPRVDGVIGQLEVYRSGAVKMRLANGILLDIRPATQPSFLQQAVYLDEKEKRLTVLGEVNKRFVVSPNMEALLDAMEINDNTPINFPDEEILIKMDTS